MRRIAFLCAVLWGFTLNLPASPSPGGDESQSADTGHTKPTPTALPTPKAEPANGATYEPPITHQQEGPSDADRGPAQKHFILVSETDDLMQTQVADNASLVEHNKIALDKRINVSLVHDVQDDSTFKGSNAALRGEIYYLNWGAATQEQLQARQGHYFTISWANHGPAANFVARFEYRQVKSKEIVRSATQTFNDLRGTTRFYFAVVDKAYLAYGPIYSWRFSILRDNTVVAQVRSFVW